MYFFVQIGINKDYIFVSLQLSSLFFRKFSGSKNCDFWHFWTNCGKIWRMLIRTDKGKPVKQIAIAGSINHTSYTYTFCFFISNYDLGNLSCIWVQKQKSFQEIIPSWFWGKKQEIFLDHELTRKIGNK